MIKLLYKLSKIRFFQWISIIGYMPILLFILSYLHNLIYSADGVRYAEAENIFILICWLYIVLPLFFAGIIEYIYKFKKINSEDVLIKKDVSFIVYCIGIFLVAPPFNLLVLIIFTLIDNFAYNTMQKNKVI